ncbi:hypothetical protein BV25DRAFT_1901373 [Artomyces pyxidatus]|uniref:Uncharacterized protein n=1 Tax=Artomyces pyxidatus TaxID=48021 RepID=A0ACB8STU1_9AGAM|nr:hypothetical protein BV25DRAFT_1901373 [Artomyces pyxidatus]
MSQPQNTTLPSLTALYATLNYMAARDAALHAAEQMEAVGEKKTFVWFEEVAKEETVEVLEAVNEGTATAADPFVHFKIVEKKVITMETRGTPYCNYDYVHEPASASSGFGTRETYVYLSAIANHLAKNTGTLRRHGFWVRKEVLGRQRSDWPDAKLARHM